ncbi:hypothetical protein CERSUDRAFT_81089 [Gelatoporia subvermispora B]|uniref:DUF6533 domain-containing protein n=1 Tax=Ceriporiopsis subvermispora (strain B) TaxID=914234 RepID=M2QRJ9_CERS8|nr:hypothetical protein CERSUDRAFT_81089 [Gelatoporia subvermispora B]
MSLSDPAVVVEVTSILQAGRLQGNLQVAAAALVLYDHLITFGREVNFIWGRKFNSVTLLFHLNRWSIFLFSILNVAIDFQPLASIPSCRALNTLNDATEIMLYILWAAFSTIRIYAMSGGNWLLSLLVCTLSIVPAGTNSYGFFATYWYSLQELPYFGLECITNNDVSPNTANILVIVTRTSVITADLIVLLATWFKTYSIMREAKRHNLRTPLAKILLQDDLRRVAYDESSNNAGTRGQRPSFIRTADDHAASQSSGLRFRTFVSEMGEHLSYGSDSTHPDMVWTTQTEFSEGHTDEEKQDPAIIDTGSDLKHGSYIDGKESLNDGVVISARDLQIVPEEIELVHG